MKKPVTINSFYMTDFIKRPTGGLTMNVYVPVSEQKLPVVLWFIGSGFKDYYNYAYEPPIMSLLEYGFAVAKVEYRMSYDAIFPAQIQDARAGVRFLRKHADEFGIDPNRIGASGESAGGQLSLLLGMAGDVKEFDDDPYGDYSAAVQAVCECFGPTNCIGDDILNRPPDPQHYMEDLFGGELHESKVQALAKQASPLTYVGAGKEIPYLIFHGDEDPLVPVTQSRVLVQDMHAAGHDITYQEMPGFGHNALVYLAAKSEFLDFYQRHLGHGTGS